MGSTCSSSATAIVTAYVVAALGAGDYLAGRGTIFNGAPGSLVGSLFLDPRKAP